MHKAILKNPLSASELGSMLVSLLLAVVFLYGCDKAVGQEQAKDVEPAVAQLGAASARTAST
jgi:hypothetical protein